MVTVASILAGNGIWIWYFWRSTPTLIPSSTSVGDNLSLSLTTNLAICFKWITYFLSVPSSMILLHLATCKGCSVARLASYAKFHCEGRESPVSCSLTPKWMEDYQWAYWSFQPSPCSLPPVFWWIQHMDPAHKLWRDWFRLSRGECTSFPFSPQPYSNNF